MRGQDEQQLGVFSYVCPEQRISHDHPLRQLRIMADDALRELKPRFSRLYAKTGRPSIAPEKLLRALLHGALLEAWAGQKGFHRVDDNYQPPINGTGEGSNPTVNFHREKRSNQTHCSTTDPDAMLSRKSRGSCAVLAYRGHLLTENRNGLVVSTLTTRAYGSAERDAALLMAEGLPGTHRVTLGADKGYDAHDFIAELRHMEITPHIAQNDTNRRTAVDERTTHHAGYEVSQKKRKRIEEVFGWMKSIGLLRKLRHRGLERVGWMFTFAAAAYNLVRIRNLIRNAPQPQVA